ncbi:MAG: hypothetical protein ACLGIA_12940 [Actinomycetes bacterium]
MELQGERQINQIDAAIASCDPDKVSIAWPRPGADGYVVGTTDNPDPEEQHAKVGRTTGLTRGRLTREGHLTWIDYGGLGMLRFDDVTVYESAEQPFAGPGDSGSLIYGENSRLAAGLLFAGADTGGKYGTGTTLAIPVVKVLAALRTELVVSGGAQ